MIETKGVEFYTEKKDNEWLTKEKRSRAVILRAKTEKQAVSNTLILLDNKTKKDIKKSIDLALYKRRVNRRANSQIYKTLFKNIFKVELRYFRDMVLSIAVDGFQFDIIAFDKFIKVPDSVSCKDYVKQKYGDTALKMIERLI